MTDYVVGKNPCPRCRKNGRDNSGDNFHWYGEGLGGYCHSCSYTILSDDEKSKRGIDDDEQEEEVATRVALTDEENREIKSYTTTDGQDWRGIRRETNQFFGVRYEIDTETGEPCKQYVPTTIDGKLVGYRVRKFPKDFSGGIGQIGKEVDMIGEFRFKNNTKVCLLVGGETKQLLAYQMLKDDIARKGKEWEPPAVVCSTLGETGAYKQVQSRYAFFSQFERIIVCMDADEPGKEAAEKICKVLPKGKAFIMHMRYKDADDYVKAGAERDFITDYWAGYNRPYVPAGIVGSGELGSKIREELAIEKIPFPPFMEELNNMTAGGIPLGKIINIGAASGIGKTTIVDTLVYYWVFNSPHLPGVVSMESNAGQYGISMLSRHIKKKINNIKSVTERQAFMEQEWVKEAERGLYFKEDGTNRFFLVDDRDGSLDDLKAVVEELIISCGVKVVVLDPIQDLLEGLDEKEQGMFLKWQKGLIKSHTMTFININHVRKNGGGGQANSRGGRITEEDFHGSSTIFKSASLNILLSRDKMAEDEVERNTTIVELSKNRDNSVTGPAGEFIYDSDTHQLANKAEWLKRQNKEF